MFQHLFVLYKHTRNPPRSRFVLRNQDFFHGLICNNQIRHLIRFLRLSWSLTLLKQMITNKQIYYIKYCYICTQMTLSTQDFLQVNSNLRSQLKRGQPME